MSQLNTKLVEKIKNFRLVDDTKKKYNIEIQRADKGTGAKRARYNSNIIDANSLA